MRHTQIAILCVLASTVLGGQALSQTQAPAQPPATEAFASENAILDTSVLFAIGAREAQQELRGAFGWPTFQEGLVEGVYFRFDPDGYARFAPTPRLDADVFEVICRPRTFSCMGRKQTLSMMLNAQGQLQLKIDDVVQGDQFIIADGVTELPVPDRILMPLEPRLESLLAAGGELVVRRGENEMARIPLTGFNAVASYLRWIAARQDYTILPRGWPVPNSTNGTDPSGLTQTATWQSPMPQPHMQPLIPADQGAILGAGVQSEVAEVRGELNVLRELLLERSGQAVPAPDIQPASVGTDRISDLERAAADIQRQLASLRGGADPMAPFPDPGMTGMAPPPATGFTTTAGAPPLTFPATTMPSAVTAPQEWPGSGPVAVGQSGFPATASPERSDAGMVAQAGAGHAAIARKLSYLITEIGLDPKSAIMLLEAGRIGAPALPVESQPTASDLETQLVDGILRDLSGLPQVAAPAQPIATPASALAVPTEEFQLLSDYFRSVLQPAAAQMPLTPQPLSGAAIVQPMTQPAAPGMVSSPVASLLTDLVPAAVGP